jgi:hypothetical protein
MRNTTTRSIDHADVQFVAWQDADRQRSPRQAQQSERHSLTVTSSPSADLSIHLPWRRASTRAKTRKSGPLLRVYR